MNMRAPDKTFVALLPLAAALLLAFDATAQDHSQHQMPAPAAQQDHSQHQAVKPKPKPKRATPSEPISQPRPAPSTVDHAAMGHGTPEAAPAEVDHAAMGHKVPTPETEVDHAAMGHGTPQLAPAEVDHAAMGHEVPTPQPAAEVDHAAMGHGTPEPAPAEVDHAAMGHKAPETEVDHAAMGHGTPEPAQPPMDHAAMGHAMPRAPDQPRTPIPVVTDADRAAAVPPPENHAVHDNTIQSFVLFNRLEAFDADGGTGLEWEGQAWVGTDLNKLWLRTEGERAGGGTESAGLEVLYGRAIAPWWDLVAGVRHDFKPGASQDFAAIGLVGLAPYKFEVEATAYIGQSGQTAARIEAEYETLLTNRLILQPLVELNVYGKDDARRGIGSGLSTMEAGLRLRYEITRQFAPYIGVVREWSFGRTADLRRDEGEDANDTRVVAGVRIWF